MISASLTCRKTAALITLAVDILRFRIVLYPAWWSALVISGFEGLQPAESIWQGRYRESVEKEGIEIPGRARNSYKGGSSSWSIATMLAPIIGAMAASNAVTFSACPDPGPS
jgi:hypothetical protein